jgi:hypothetical protein
MKQVDQIGIDELEEMAENMYGELVKAVVDVEKRTMVVDAGLHVDEEQWLLEAGSRQSDLWGINLYPDSFGDDDFVEFDSMINIRPAQGNRSRSVEDASLRNLIIEIVEEIVHG